jgi:hypothetical protein
MYRLYLQHGSWVLVISDLVEMAAGLTPRCNKGINVMLAITSTTVGDSDKIDADLKKLTSAIKDNASVVTLNYTQTGPALSVVPIHAPLRTHTVCGQYHQGPHREAVASEFQ